MIGKTLSHYRVVEKIGAGGMGEIYRAIGEARIALDEYEADSAASVLMTAPAAAPLLDPFDERLL